MATRRERVFYELSAQDGASAVFRRVESSARGMAGGFEQVRSAVTLLASGAFVRSMINAAQAGEDAQLRLTAALRATGNAIGFTRSELDELADTMAASTRFDDDALRTAQAQLTKFGNITGEVFKGALKASADLAAFMGTDVATAAQQVGRALQSPTEGVTLLERTIGKLTDAEEEHIRKLAASGRAVEAQAEVLKILENRIGGTAEGMNRGLGGAIAGATKAWDDFLEALGRTEAVGGRVERTLQGLASLLKDLESETKGEGSPLSTWWLDLFTGWGKMLGVLKPEEIEAARALLQGRGRGGVTGVQDIERFEMGLNPAPRIVLGGTVKPKGAAGSKATGDYGSPEARMEAAEAALGAEYARGVSLVTDKLTAQAEAVRNAIDPWHVYRTELEKLRELRDAGLITQTEFVTAAGEAAKTAAGEMEDLRVETTSAFEDMKAAVDDFGREMARSLARGEAGFRSLGDVASRFLEELLAIQLEKRLIGPALSAGTSYLDSLFAGGTADAYYGTAAPFHTGGIVGREGGSRRRVHPALFAAAPRLHGGLMPDEYPAILQRGEGVFTPEQMRALGGGGNVRVNVYNETGAQVQAQASPPRIDSEGVVVDLWLRGLSRNGAARQQAAALLAPPSH